MNIEDFDKFGEKLNDFLQNRERSETEQIHEVMAAVTIFTVKEGNFEEALNMIKQSVKSLAVEPSLLDTWRNEVQERLREASNDELGLDDSQRQQLERVLLGLDE
ncbi:MAG: hypothetical protein U7123_14945 [Potamolinea sp.]